MRRAATHRKVAVAATNDQTRQEDARVYAIIVAVMRARPDHWFTTEALAQLAGVATNTIANVCARHPSAIDRWDVNDHHAMYRLCDALAGRSVRRDKEIIRAEALIRRGVVL